MSTGSGDLPLAVVFILVAAIAAPVLARWHRRLPLGLACCALLASDVLLGSYASRVYQGHPVTDFVSGQRPAHGASLGIALVADPLGLTFALLAVTVGLVLVVAILSELGELGRRELGGLCCLTLLLLASLVGAALAGDLINLFVWFEVAALSSYGLTGFFLERPIALEAAFKILVLTSSAGFVLFMGAALLYEQTGALNLGQLHLALASGTRPDSAALLAIALAVAAFATKAGLVPFHPWLPDAHTPVPGPVSALFSALMVDLGIVGIVRVGRLASPANAHVLGWLTVVGVLSTLVGACLALVQDDLKRLLAWDTVSQMGVLALGFGASTPEGSAGAIYHLINHGLFKALLFLCAGAVVHMTGETSLSRMGGLLRLRPVLSVAFLVACASIAGLPPLNGYSSLGLIHDGLTHEPAVLIAAVLAQILTVAALGRAAWLGFLRPRSAPYEHLEPLRAGQKSAFGVLAAGCVALGILAAVVVRHVAAPVAGELANPAAYARAALGIAEPIPKAHISFSYLDPVTLVSSLAEVAAGLTLLWLFQRRPVLLRPIHLLRQVHSGSINDYVLWWTVGVAATGLVVLA